MINKFGAHDRRDPTPRLGRIRGSKANRGDLAPLLCHENGWNRRRPAHPWLLDLVTASHGRWLAAYVEAEAGGRAPELHNGSGWTTADVGLRGLALVVEKSEVLLQTASLPRGGEPSGIAGANPARVGVMPISSNGFGPGVALLLLLGAPFPHRLQPEEAMPIPIRAGDRLGDLRKAAVDAAVPGVPAVITPARLRFSRQQS